MTRACGDCQVCCTVLQYDFREDVKSAAGVPCRHQCAEGCGIHPSRPQGCRDFRCVWLRGFGEDTERPDRSGALIHFVKQSACGGWPGRDSAVERLGGTLEEHVAVHIHRADPDWISVYRRVYAHIGDGLAVFMYNPFEGIATAFGPRCKDGIRERMEAAP